jgi:hypothetical protein|tara:strand:+ start:1144 stop:1530 length:387 start_codon:yes stop_codon:yes gene_type:complete
MAIIYVHQFHIDLLGLNEDLYHVYIDSHVETGGGRDVVHLRQHDRGIPLTLRENFSDNGTLTSNTEKRDIVKIENQFQTINYVSDQGKVICLPILGLTEELLILEKQSPKLAGYVKKRLQSLGLKKKI